MKRCVCLKSFLNDFDIDDIGVLFPDVRENRTIESLCNKIEVLDEVTKALKQEDITVADVWF